MCIQWNAHLFSRLGMNESGPCAQKHAHTHTQSEHFVIFQLNFDCQIILPYILPAALSDMPASLPLHIFTKCDREPNEIQLAHSHFVIYLFCMQ